MNYKDEIYSLVHQYVQKFTGEKDRSQPLLDFLAQYHGEELISRNNFTGHITTSAFIVNRQGDELLLLKHKSLDRWLQPGGHVDSTDPSLIASALREAVEETGISSEQLRLLSADIFDIDSHRIPGNTRKHEPAHVHHDVRFLFQYVATAALNISLEESTDSKWIPIAELNDTHDFNWFERKLKAFR